MRSLAIIPLLVEAVFAAPYAPFQNITGTTFNNTVIYNPPIGYGFTTTVRYARTAQLSDGSILATWENDALEPPLPSLPIFRSINYGVTWTNYSQVQDTVNGWGLRSQPVIFELPAAIGDYPKGTVLVAGNSIPDDFSATKIDVYASLDKGLTWTFASSVATGDSANSNNGNPAVWEPFLLYYNGSVVCYYSDQRDKNHAQKLVHQVSSDLLTWDDPVDDVSYYKYTDRPGMSTVSLLGNGQYFLTYEYGGGPSTIGGYGPSYPVYYCLNSNPLLFNQSTGHQLYTDRKAQPNASPTNAWSPVGGVNGTIFVSSADSNDVYVNQALGDPKAWKSFSPGSTASYARSLLVLNSNTNHLLIAGGGAFPGAGGYGTQNNITATVQDIGNALKVLV